jgi:hypothetical protein
MISCISNASPEWQGWYSGQQTIRKAERSGLCPIARATIADNLLLRWRSALMRLGGDLPKEPV